MRPVNLRTTTCAAVFATLLALIGQVAAQEATEETTGALPQETSTSPIEEGGAAVDQHPLARASLLRGGPSRCWQVRLPLPHSSTGALVMTWESEGSHRPMQKSTLDGDLVQGVSRVSASEPFAGEVVTSGSLSASDAYAA